MNFKYSASLMAAAVSMLTISAPPAYSEMKGMSMNHYGSVHGQMMELNHMDRMDRMGDMAGMCIEHASSMGLTDEQIVNIKPIHIQMQKKQAQFRADQKIAEIELKEIMDVKDFNLEKAGIGVRKIADIKTAHHLEMLKNMKEVRSILSEDQFKKMKQMMTMKAGTKIPAKK